MGVGGDVGVRESEKERVFIKRAKGRRRKGRRRRRPRRRKRRRRKKEEREREHVCLALVFVQERTVSRTSQENGVRASGFRILTSKACGVAVSGCVGLVDQFVYIIILLFFYKLIRYKLA